MKRKIIVKERKTAMLPFASPPKKGKFKESEIKILIKFDKDTSVILENK